MVLFLSGRFRLFVVACLLSVSLRAEDQLEVSIRVEGIQAENVAVAGEFNHWSTTVFLLERAGEDAWQGTIKLPPGRYGYKLVVDGEWQLDPSNPRTVTLDGVLNSLLDTAVAESVTGPRETSEGLRAWTSRAGSTIEAEFVGEEEGQVSLRTAEGRIVAIRGADLSSADQAWLARHREAHRAAELAAIPRGRIDRLPLTTRQFESPKAYLDGSHRRGMKAYYRDHIIVFSKAPSGHRVTDPLDYDPAEEAAFVYVPESYDGTSGWGLLVHVDPGDGSSIPAGWQEVCDRNRLIYACAWGAENGKPDLRRIGLALDTLATVRSLYRVDDRRVYIGGLSGGGLIAMQTALMYPDLFRGAISHAAQCEIENADGWSHVPYLDRKGWRDFAGRDMRWVFVTGEKDKNYRDILRMSQSWEDLRIPYRVFDVPGMGHEVASGDWLDAIVRWLDGGDVSGAEPRYEDVGILFRARRL